ncbi:alanine racemase [Leptospira sp. GIMC2001]|uniref:alanine racemase n=1 Tax=Leptospira sp. GIMC2001 TaxID=1513297 RepID=UPI00234BF579|nr:alanine racemase [Leptospira sp. GIMC2001]WCL47809.1 alanine racemase [Leptospira sp. GIMC2001]
MLSAKIELSRSALVHNVRIFRELIESNKQKTKFCAVLKSNAYGHGIYEMIDLCLDASVDLFGVNSLEEAQIIRQKHKTIPILIMGDIPNIRNRANDLSDTNFWVIVSRLVEWEFLSNLDIRPRIHLKTDTGMGRLGHSGESLRNILSEAHSKGLPLEGIATHFASTEDFTEHSYSQKQLKTFQEHIEIANSFGYTNLIKHCAASASALLFDEARMDMVRIGIALYGLWPSMETKLSMKLLGKPEAVLKPVLVWKSQIQHIQEVPTGTFIGYGSTYKTTSPTRVGVVPVGYYEGLDRKLSNNGYMLVAGKRARILGRICMNMTMIDITHIDSAILGDEVVIIGSSQNEYVSADDLSLWSNTINYETTTSILSLLPRNIID